MIDVIFESVYTKLLIIVMLALMITFVNEIDFFKKRIALLVIALIIVLLYYATINNKDYGIIILSICLFVLVYNQQINQ